MATAPIREAVGVFQSIEAFRNAADNLMLSGFDRADLSVLGSHHAIEDGLGHMCDRIAELEDDPLVPTRAYYAIDSPVEGAAALFGVLVFIGAIVGAAPVIAGGGTTAMATLSAVIGAAIGGTIGGAGIYLIRKRYTDNLQEQLNHGGIPLWVRTTDPAHEEKACDVLRSAQAKDVHVHDRPPVEDTDVIYGVLHRLAGIRKPSARKRRVLS